MMIIINDKVKKATSQVCCPLPMISPLWSLRKWNADSEALWGNEGGACQGLLIVVYSGLTSLDVFAHQ